MFLKILYNGAMRCICLTASLSYDKLTHELFVETLLPRLLIGMYCSICILNF